MSSEIKGACLAFQSKEYAAAFDILYMSSQKRYSGWTERTSPPTDEAWKEAGFADQKEYIAFANDVIAAAADKVLGEINDLAAENPLQAKEKFSEFQSQIYVIDNNALVDVPAPLQEVFVRHGYGDGSSRAVYKKRDDITRQADIYEETKAIGDVIALYNEGKAEAAVTRATIREQKYDAPMCYPLERPDLYFADTGDSYRSSVRNAALANYCEATGNTETGVKDLYRDIWIFQKLKDFKDSVYRDSPKADRHSWKYPANLQDQFQKVMDNLGFRDFSDIPAPVLSLLNKDEERRFDEKLITEMHLMADYDRAYYKGILPATNTPFLKDLKLAKTWAQAVGKETIFARMANDNTSRTAHEKRIGGNVMARYRTILEERDDPDYPASQVRRDYLAAAVDGAPRPAFTFGERVSILAARLGLRQLPAPNAAPA